MLRQTDRNLWIPAMSKAAKLFIAAICLGVGMICAAQATDDHLHMFVRIGLIVVMAAMFILSTYHLRDNSET